MISTSWASHTLARNPNPSTRVHPRSEVAVNGLKRKQCAAKRCTCSQANPCYASVFAKRSDGRRCAAAMDGHTWAAVNGRKHKHSAANGFAGCDCCILATWTECFAALSVTMPHNVASRHISVETTGHQRSAAAMTIVGLQTVSSSRSQLISSRIFIESDELSK